MRQHTVVCLSVVGLFYQARYGGSSPALEKYAFRCVGTW